IKQIPIKQLPIKQIPNVIREEQIRDDRIIGVLEINVQEEICSICLTAFDIENLDGVVIPCQNNHIFHFRCIDRWSRRVITCPICRVLLQPDELWRNVVPENILRPDAIALQRYREIQVNDNRILQQIVIEEEEEFNQQDVLECPICHIPLHQGGNVIQLCNN
ncbi:2030_t:CDS:2, partial [Dentiscutata erythropus]